MTHFPRHYDPLPPTLWLTAAKFLSWYPAKSFKRSIQEVVVSKAVHTRPCVFRLLTITRNQWTELWYRIWFHRTSRVMSIVERHKKDTGEKYHKQEAEFFLKKMPIRLFQVQEGPILHFDVRYIAVLPSTNIFQALSNVSQQRWQLTGRGRSIVEWPLDRVVIIDRGSTADGDLGIVVTPVFRARRNDRVFRTARTVLT